MERSGIRGSGSLPSPESLVPSPQFPPVIALNPTQQGLGGVLALPFAGGVFIGLAPAGVGVNGAEDLVEAEAVLHGQYKLGQHLAGLLGDDGNAEYAIGAGSAEHFDEAIAFRSLPGAVGNGAVELLEIEAGN